MRILVIDDNETHRAAAQAQLAEHELTVVGTYDEGQERILSGGFEAVLVDLLMPASGQQQGDGAKYVGQEMPVGIFLALLAAQRGARYVAVFTDSDHHSHPASACFDAINSPYPLSEMKPAILTVEGARLALCNNRNWLWKFDPSDLSRRMSFEEYYVQKQPSVHAKDWGAVYRYLTIGNDGSDED